MWLFPPFRLDAGNQRLWRGDVSVALMPKPFAVLQYLVEHAGRLVTQNELYAAIWPDTHVQPEVLRRYILEVRRALGDQAESPRFIETLPKRGYRFIAAVTPSAATVPPDAIASTGPTLVDRKQL
jgi:DNA-binding winged helix-turn-helix (wHTH) protein